MGPWEPSLAAAFPSELPQQLSTEGGNKQGGCVLNPAHDDLAPEKSLAAMPKIPNVSMAMQNKEEIM